MNVGDPNGTVVVELLPRESDMPVIVMITDVYFNRKVYQ